MLEQLLQITTYMDTTTKVAAHYTKFEEEIILETSDHKEIPQEEKDKEMKQTKEPTKAKKTMVPDLLIKDKQEDAAKDKSGPSIEDWGKGPIQIEIIQIPNDSNLKAIMKENEIFFNDYAKDFFFKTNVLFQEVQKSQINLFNKL